MATMVITQPQISLSTSNGHALDGTEEIGPGNGVHIDSNGIHQDACDEAYNQSTPGKARAAAELPSMISSFKNVVFGSNGSNAPETQGGNHDDSGAQLANGSNGDQHQDDQNGAPDPTHDSACNEHSDADSQEKLDFLPVSEPQELVGAFPAPLGHPSSSHAAEDQHPTNVTASNTAKIPSRPSSPYVQGQDVHINSVQMIPASGTQGDAVVSTTNIRSASYLSAKGEFHHQEQHTVLNSTSHPQSQFLLTISAPSPVPSQSGHYESGETGLSYQNQSSQISEAPHQMGSKDACQLPDCVMSRACAGVAAAEGAQLEHLLARVKQEKTVSQARAWEEGAKAKAYNRYTRDESKITAWENTMKAKAEARMHKAQENLDKQRAKHIERMKNAVASAHCKAQERRAAMEARRAEDIVKAEETASRIRATGKMPRKCLCVPA